jgi:hypothetical protein
VWLHRATPVLFLLSTAVAADPVTQLVRSIEEKKVEVRFDEQHGYLPWLLEALGIPIESQMLVFSKTSVQALRIEPRRPRTLYFNDSVIVGSVPGGAIELAAQDPQRGMIFYLLDQAPILYRAFLAQPKPVFPIMQRNDCATCHLSKTSGAMETLIRSVAPDSTGIPLPGFVDRITDNRTPFDQLWGGWYVTGKTEAKHRGNTVIVDGKEKYLEPTGSSDIVALMVFEHQMRVMNLLSRAAPGSSASDLADALLFEGEPVLPAPVTGDSLYAETFTARGPHDRKGRSLHTLDLNTRLMRYQCSYMIYSAAFEALPPATRTAVYRRMWDLLGKRDRTQARAIIEILRDTKNDLPDYYERSE